MVGFHERLRKATYLLERPTPFAMSAQSSLIAELDDALLLGNSEWRTKTLRQVTDLFVSAADRYSQQQLALFDHVFGRFLSSVEISARATLAQRLAANANAPPCTIRTLAFDDHIDVAGPL